MKIGRDFDRRNGGGVCGVLCTQELDRFQVDYGQLEGGGVAVIRFSGYWVVEVMDGFGFRVSEPIIGTYDCSGVTGLPVV